MKAVAAALAVLAAVSMPLLRVSMYINVLGTLLFSLVLIVNDFDCCQRLSLLCVWERKVNIAAEVACERASCSTQGTSPPYNRGAMWRTAVALAGYAQPIFRQRREKMKNECRLVNLALFSR